MRRGRGKEGKREEEGGGKEGEGVRRGREEGGHVFRAREGGEDGLMLDMLLPELKVNTKNTGGTRSG